MPEAGLKNSLKRPVLWAGFILILLLTVFSIYGAFIGVEAAQKFFNSIPLAVYWLTFIILLILSIFIFPRLLHWRGSFLNHIGCVIILLGGIIGSQAGFAIYDKLSGTDTIRKGQMIINSGSTERAVEMDNGIIKMLPFAIKLVNFKIDYYQPGQLIIRAQNGQGFKIPAETGHKYDLGDEFGIIEIVEQYEYFKLSREGDKRFAIEDVNGGPNPALEISWQKPDGNNVTRYVFQRFPGHARPEDNLQFSYQRAIKDFISELEVIKDNKVVAQKSIEVNKPLHCEGFLFYQQGYDVEAARYSILGVTNDRGLGIVFIGFILLCIGVFWHFWFRHILGDREMEE